MAPRRLGRLADESSNSDDDLDAFSSNPAPNPRPSTTALMTILLAFLLSTQLFALQSSFDQQARCLHSDADTRLRNILL